MAEDKKKADEYLGGMSGDAAKALKTRKERLDEAIDGPKESPNTQPSTGADGSGRPPQRNRW